MIRAVIFDLDGTLVDSETCWAKWNAEFLRENGVPAAEEDVWPAIGGSLDLTYQVLLDRFPAGTMTMTKLHALYGAFMADKKIDYGKALNPQARQALARVKECGMKTALASASPRTWIGQMLAGCGLDSLFDVVVSGEDFLRNKPAPDVYLACAEKLGLLPQECLVVEDSRLGIASAKDAGMAAAGLQGYGGQDLSRADVVVDGLLAAAGYADYLNRRDSLVRIAWQQKELVLVPTAHVSRQSAFFAREAIEFEKPDSICVELDEDRYKSLTEKKKWENTSVSSIIKSHKTGFFLVNLALASYQKKVAKSLGSQGSGSEMLAGIEAAKEKNIPLVLADRSVQTTFQRLWRPLKGKDRIRLISGLAGSLFDREEISEEDLKKLEQKDELTAALGQMEKEFPSISRVLVTERDQYLACRIKNAPGKKVLAILGAAHTIGIQKWVGDDAISLQELEKVPPKGKGGKIFLWCLSAALILLVALTFTRNPDTAKSQVLYWILSHGILAALGCALCLAHPLTILTGFAAAPLSSLSPLLAAGWFAGLVEAHLRKPTVKDFESLGEDCSSFRGFLRNKVTRILMIVVCANIGSTLATVLGGIDIVRKFLEVFA